MEENQSGYWTHVASVGVLIDLEDEGLGLQSRRWVRLLNAQSNRFQNQTVRE